MPNVLSLPLDIHRSVLNVMNLQQLRDFGVACKAAHSDVRFELRRRVDRQMDHFRLNPSTTFETMKKYGALISGSMALAVMFPDSESFFGGDVDFYVNEQYLTSFVDEIVSSTKYRVVKHHSIASGNAPSNDADALPADNTDSLPSDNPEANPSNLEPDYPYPCIYAKRILWLEDQSEDDVRAMNVVETFDDEPFKIVPTFYSTLLMNAITPGGVVCLYPNLTMARVGVIKHSTLAVQPRVKANVLKYASRGFKMVFAWDAQEVRDVIDGDICDAAGCCPETVRDTRFDDTILWMAYRDDIGVNRQEVVPSMRWRPSVEHGAICCSRIEAAAVPTP